MAVTLRARLRQVARRLRRAYGAPPVPRRLPPLDELVLTILSQNTNDTNRDRAYADLRKKLPSWDDVADAPLPVIERAIRSGGLAPTKAPRIRAVLRALRDRGIALDDLALPTLFDLLLHRERPLQHLGARLRGVAPRETSAPEGRHDVRRGHALRLLWR